MTKPIKPADKIDMTKLKSAGCETARDLLAEVEAAYARDVLPLSAQGAIDTRTARAAAIVVDDHHRAVEKACGARAAKLPPRAASAPKPSN